MVKKITVVDSGSGAYNVLSHLIDINPQYKDFINIELLGEHIGDLSTYGIKKVFYSKLRTLKDKENIFMGCNTLNSVFPKYLGLFNELTQYLRDNGDKRHLIIATKKTCEVLNRLELKNIHTMSLGNSVVKRIDSGEVLDIEFKSNMFDYLVLGCSHYDLINFSTNMGIISTSKLGALKLDKILKECL